MPEMKSLPPWIKMFLSTICPEELYEQIEGDLIELHEHNVKTVGERKAKLLLVISTFGFLRPGILLRNKFSPKMSHVTVLGNYLKTTSRHIGKSKLNFAFKLGGLIVSIFCFIIIAIYVSYQLSFDRFHEGHQNIYRINSERKENGSIEKYGVAPMALGPMLGRQFPEISSIARIRFANSTYFRYNHSVTDCELLIEADTSLFNVLTFKFLKGNKAALKKPNGIVLTRTMADKMFGTIDALEKLITINNGKELYEITAVVENTPANSHLFVGAIMPIREAHDFTLNSIVSPVEFIDHAAATYVRFKKSIPDDFVLRVESMLDRYVKRQDRIEKGFTVFLQPLTEVYMGPKYKTEFSGKGSSVYLYAFSVLGILLLIVACINYINLSIVDLAGRSREIGVRKVLGAHKSQLIIQILAEIVIYTTISFAVSLLLLFAFFQNILPLIDPDLRFEMILENSVLSVICISLFMLIFFSAYFPARLLIKTGVNQNLKSAGVSFNSTISQALLFTQFSISALCICCTIVVGRQVGFIYNKELGFNRKNLVVLNLPEDFSVSKMITLKNSLKQSVGVTGVSNSSFRIGGGYWKDWYFVEDNEQMKSIELYEVFSDDELFSTLGIKLLKGRTFNANMPSDSGAAFVINETAARELGWSDPVGKRIYTHPEEKGKWDGTIVGMVSDINISALYEKVQPLVMRLPWQSSYPDAFVYIRYQGDEQSVIKSIEKKYGEIMPGYPLSYRFVDEFYNARHHKETKAFTSLQFGTIVIVLVSLLGVFSLATYMSARRMKEFGIRKVFGASGKQIARLHISYFIRIVLISNCIALPFAYWLIQEWLGGFAYRVELTVSPFILVVGISSILVILSGSYAAFKAARMNPVDVIKE